MVSSKSNTYTIDKAFTNISIDGMECNIKLIPSDDNKYKVVCRESDKIYHSVSVENDTLFIKRNDNREWYEHFGIYWSDMEVSVYLPENNYGELYAKSLSGEIVIPETFSFDSADVQSTSGNVRFLASVNGEMTVNTVSGELYVGKSKPSKLTAESVSGCVTVENIVAQDFVNVKAISGEIKMSEIRCQSITANTTSGGLSLSDVVTREKIQIESVSGNVDLNRCDAASLWLKTTSGNIYGTLLSEKFFVTNTLSGNVSVPHSPSGGKCEVTTTRGNIEFIIK